MSTSAVHHVGLDLGGVGHEVAVFEESTGSKVQGFAIGRGREGLEKVRREVVGELPAGGRAVYLVEAAQNFWQEVVHPLVAEGEEVYLLSPTKCAALRRYYRQHTKTDVTDAEAIARVKLTDRRIVPVWIGTPEQESLRRLCRLSWKLSQQARNQKRRIAMFLEMVLPGIGTVWRNRYCGSARLFYRRYLDPAKARRLGRKRLAQTLRRRALGKFSAQAEERLWAVIENAPELTYRYDDLALEIACELDGLEAIERQNQALRERIDELYTEVDPDRWLESVPGLGPYLAAALTAFIGDVERWRGVDALVAASGLVPRKKASSGKEKANQRLTKEGAAMARCWLYVAAEIVRQYDPELQAFYLRLKRRGVHHKAAVCATGAKLLRRAYAVLKRRTPYRTLLEGQKKGETGVRESVSEVARRLLNDEAAAAASPDRRLRTPTPVDNSIRGVA